MFRSLLASVALVAGAVSLASAAPIVINNPSFESPDVPDSGQTVSIPGWTLTAGAAVTRDNATVDMHHGFATSTHGDQVALLSGGAELRQTLLGYKIGANDNWQLSADLLGVSGTDMGMGFLQLVTVEDPTNILPAAGHAIVFSGNNWTTASFNITIASNSNRIGQTPMILLKHTTAFPSGVYFDNLRGSTTATFDASQVPEPASLSLVAGALLTLRRRR